MGTGFGPGGFSAVRRSNLEGTDWHRRWHICIYDGDGMGCSFFNGKHHFCIAPSGISRRMSDACRKN